MLIEIHMLQNHAPSNLNRDDTGSPKECIFGGVKRARISSQCLKRSIRKSPCLAQELNDLPLATRTRRLPDKIGERLAEKGLAEDLVAVAKEKASAFGTRDGKERPKELNTAQTMFLTDADIDAVAEVLYAAASEAKTAKKFKDVAAKKLQGKAQLQGWRPITLDVALFGRMITSEAFRDVEAAMQVAHAISTNRVDHEFDYFTAVDDLQASSEDDETGADMIGDVEYNSACYYKYFSLDVEGLVDNLAGPDADDEEREQAVQAARLALPAFIKAAVFTTPTGKQNSFAAHQLPDAVLVEARPETTPVSYANAFVAPARPHGNADLVAESLDKLIKHIDTLTSKFSLKTVKRFWFTTRDEFSPIDTEAAPVTVCTALDDLLEGVRSILKA